MAEQITRTLVDDIDGGKAVETLRFALDGVHYEIDLSARNASRMRKSLEEFVSAGRRVGGRQVTRRAASRRGKGPGAPTIRAWAHDNGVEVAERGAIPASVREAFDAAQQG